VAGEVGGHAYAKSAATATGKTEKKEVELQLQG